MGYGWDFTEADRAQVLGDFMRTRTEVLRLSSEGQYDAAYELSAQLVAQVLETLPASLEGVEDGMLPGALSGVAFLADASVAAIAAGRSEEAANLVQRLSAVIPGVEHVADRIAAIGIMYCQDGRPSLDGKCLQKPPCPP
jgi:hypothetical protein